MKNDDYTAFRVYTYAWIFAGLLLAFGFKDLVLAVMKTLAAM